MTDIRHPIRIVTQRTGLSSHVVRVWERRYEAVTPDRSGTNRRLYSEEEIKRLDYLAKLTKGGLAISQIAKRPTEELAQLVADLPTDVDAASTGRSGKPDAEYDGHEHFQRGLAAIEDLDSDGLKEVIDEAAAELGGSRLIEELIVPLIGAVGERWEEGTLTAAQEHSATAVFKETLLVASRPHSDSSGAPDLIVTTPSGQLHELGAAIVACMARRRGWSVTYLGPSLPADEIAAAVKLRGSVAVALSIVYPGDDPDLPGELERLRRLLPEGMPILVGGRRADSYGEALDAIRAVRFSELNELKVWLEAGRG